jgi:adenylate cyclase
MKKLLSPWMALLTLALLVFIRVQDPSFVESIRLRYFDQLITSKESTVSQQVAVVNIDDEIIRQKGQFPFPRREYASIIADLYSRNAGLVVFSVYMPDADRFGGDATLASTLKKYPVVLPHVATAEQSTAKYEPFRPGVSIIGEGDVGINYGTIQPNVKVINDAAAGVGIVNVLPEIDGVTRRMPMVVRTNDLLYPSMSMETLRVAAGDPSFQVKVNEGSIEALRIPQFGKIVTDSVGRIWIDWSSKPQEYSLAELPQDFGGKIVIVGITGKGLNNPVATAIGSVFPHHVQASVLDTVTSGANISRPDWATGAELLFIVVLSILSLVLITRFTHGYVPALALGFATYYGGVQLFLQSGYLLDAVFPILTVGLVSFHGYVVKFLVELRQKLQIKKQFGTYLSPALVEKLQKNPELLVLGGESRELSIMFTDVRGFTTISEHYGKDVQGLTKIMNRYMTAMTAKIIENNGTLDKYIGDAQMAFWNAPLDEPNHAKMAVKTALQMMDSLDAFNAEIAAEGVPAFGMGLGINTGVVVVGNMGSSQRFDYTCLGDHVNLASRLEGQSKPYGVKIILGPLTAEQVKDEYEVVELDCIAVKGKKEGVKIYTLGRSIVQESFLEAYYTGEWERAIAIAEEAIADKSSLTPYYEKMLERLKDGKPIDWDGVYRATSK